MAINEVTGEGPGEGVPINLDQWDGYTADRRELIEHLDTPRRITDTVFLTGDIHSAWANDLPLDTGTYPGHQERRGGDGLHLGHLEQHRRAGPGGTAPDGDAGRSRPRCRPTTVT